MSIAGSPRTLRGGQTLNTGIGRIITTGLSILLGLSFALFVGFIVYAMLSLPLDDCPPPTQAPSEYHLPTKCRPFYEDSTDAWIECMGVGRR